MMDSRREFLKKAALLTGGAGLFSMLPPAVQKALAINPQTGSTYMDAEHIVLLMQENRSFDHCFGTLQGVRGFNDPRAIDLPNKNKVWLQSSAKGETYAPFRLDIKNTKATWMESLPHSWTNQVDARNDGKFNGWIEAKRSGHPEYRDIPMTMGYYTREDIPFYYSFADAFTVCDQHFCSSLTGTTPNRLFFFSGTLREDAQAMARVRNENTDYDAEAAWDTFPERLEDNGISWKIYQNELSAGSSLSDEADPWLSNFTDNPIEWFKQYNVKLSKGYIAWLQKAPERIKKRIERMENLLTSLPPTGKRAIAITKGIAYNKKTLERVFAEQKIYTEDMYAKLSQREKNLHDKAFTVNKNDPDYHQLSTLKYTDEGLEREMKIPKGDVLHQFRDDVKNGKLPTVSWLVAPEKFSDHPGAPWYGAWYVNEVMDILTQNPEVWKKTIFILTYDENDGCFDHVPPFVAPKPNLPETGLVSKGIDTKAEQVTMRQELKYNHTEEDARESPVGLGYRVPMVIASPWSRGGWVNSEVFDHTSCLQFLEHFINKKFKKNIEEKNISSWRRTICGDLTTAFRPYKAEKIEPLPFPEKNEFMESIERAKFKNAPSDYKLLTAQEINQINHHPQSSPYMPVQEKGVRSSCALPYELYVDGKLNSDKTKIELSFKAATEVFGSSAAGSPFNVYAPGRYADEMVKAWSYAVTAGDTLVDTWALDDFENDSYHLRVYGPNGFYRELMGDMDDPLLEVECLYERSKSKDKKPTGNIIVKLTNKSSKPHKVELVDNAYKTGTQSKTIAANATATVLIDLQKSHNWYDFSVVVEGNDSFEKRYAGRVETGNAGVSDPVMGGVEM